MENRMKHKILIINHNARAFYRADTLFKSTCSSSQSEVSIVYCTSDSGTPLRTILNKQLQNVESEAVTGQFLYCHFERRHPLPHLSQ